MIRQLVVRGTMHRLALSCIVTTLLIISSYTSASAISNPDQVTITGCPTYQTNLAVVLVDSNPATPIQVKVGDIVVTTFHVVYPDGTPVTLQPETSGFLWTGNNGQKEFDNVPVTYAGVPGFYNYTQVVTGDLITATGGTARVSVVACTCSDGLGNQGPTGFISSGETIDPTDNSRVLVGTEGSQLAEILLSAAASYAVVLVILALTIVSVLLLLLVLLRGRRRK